MIIQTQQQRDNTLDALNNMWPSVPEENVALRLSFWRESRSRAKKPDCNTIACFGGWCAVWPAFQTQGVSVHPAYGSPTTPGNIYFPHEVAKALFGDVSIFNSRGLHLADDNFTGSDHALVTNRLKELLNNSKVRS